jgi:hypothetical protein
MRCSVIACIDHAVVDSYFVPSFLPTTIPNLPVVMMSLRFLDSFRVSAGLTPINQSINHPHPSMSSSGIVVVVAAAAAVLSLRRPPSSCLPACSLPKNLKRDLPKFWTGRFFYLHWPCGRFSIIVTVIGGGRTRPTIWWWLL